jgi:hypothetical protein
VVVTGSWVVVVSPTVVVGASAAVVVVVASNVVVVGAAVVVVGSTVVVGATELTGAGGGSVVVGAREGAGGAGVAGGPVGLGTVAGVVVRGAASVVGAWAARAIGDAPGGGSWGTVLVDDDPGPALEEATDAGAAGDGGLVVSAGSCWTAEGARGVLGTSAADATRAASTAKVSPKATSMRRQGSRCSARWRGVRGGMSCPRRRILRIVRSNGKSPSVIME